jgi:hypothetical protein
MLYSRNRYKRALSIAHRRKAIKNRPYYLSMAEKRIIKERAEERLYDDKALIIIYKNKAGFYNIHEVRTDSTIKKDIKFMEEAMDIAFDNAYILNGLTLVASDDLEMVIEGYNRYGEIITNSNDEGRTLKTLNRLVFDFLTILIDRKE